jgi:hypothetical protein
MRDSDPAPIAAMARPALERRHVDPDSLFRGQAARGPAPDGGGMSDDQTPHTGPDRRGAIRFATSLAISLRQAGRHQLPATLLTLSPMGCSVSNASSFSSDGVVWIRLPGIESQAARCVWSTYGGAGFAFESPLYPPVIERFRPGGTDPAAQPLLTVVSDLEACPASRRDQIMLGRAEPDLLVVRRPRGGSAANVFNLIRRTPVRGSDFRHEHRFAAPDEAQAGFRIDGEVAQVGNISASGLSVAGELAGEIGRTVTVSYGDFPDIAGTLVWVRDGTTGISLPEDSLHLDEAA